MAYEYIDYLKPSGTARFALLEDVFLKGSYRVLQTEADRDSIDRSACKEGMLVYCLDTDKSYILSEFSTTEDEFGDLVVVAGWSEFEASIPNTESGTKALGRWSLILTSGSLLPGESRTTKIPLSRACILRSLSVNTNCRVRLRETDQLFASGDLAMFNHTIEADLNTASGLSYGEQFSFPDGTVLNTRYLQMFMNKDAVEDKLLYYRVTNTNATSVNIISRFVIVSLHN